MKKTYLTLGLGIALAKLSYAQDVSVPQGNALVVHTVDNSIGVRIFGRNMSFDPNWNGGYMQMYGSYMYDDGGISDNGVSGLHFANGANLISINSGGLGSPIGIQFNAFGGSSYFNSGNVGIHTTTPNAVLDVGEELSPGQLGTVFGRLGEGNSTGDGTYLGVKGYDTQPPTGQDPSVAKSFAIEHSFYGVTNSAINFYRGAGTYGGSISFNTFNNSEVMRIGSNGDVGIGTASPTNKLDVDITTNTEGKMVSVFTPTGQNSTNTPIGGLQFNWHGGNLAQIQMVRGYGASDGLGLSFHTSYNGGVPVERMRILNSGNIGIGTLTPDQMLTVAGTIHSKQVIVDNNITTPDYVFEKNYKLRPLEEVSRFVGKYKHLPEIASAQEMDGKAIDLNQMNMKLLQKVEELTLYVIELKKSNAVERHVQAEKMQRMERKLKAIASK